MPWVNLDDAFPDHPKNDALTDAAFRLHVAGICYANRHLTDGLIPADKVTRLVPRFRTSTLKELLARGHWRHIESIDTYEIHDFLQWNRPREKVIAERERKSKAGKKGAEKRWHEQ